MEDAKFVSKLIDIINTLRVDIEESVPLIDEFKEYLLVNYPNKTKELEQLDDISKYLSQGEVESLSEIQEKKELSDLAAMILQNISEKPGKRIFPESEEILNASLQFFFSDFKLCKNFVSTEDTPKKVLKDLLINLNSIEDGKHLLLDPTINYIGVAHDYIKDKPVTVIILSDSVKEREETSLAEALIDDLNTLRAYPKVALKILPENSKSNEDLIKQKAPCPELNINEKLAKAAIDRFETLDQSNEALKGPKLTQYLNQYGSGHLVSEEIIINEPFTNALDIVLILLREENTINIIFSRKLKEIGFAIDLENGTAIIFLANNFEEPIEEKIIEVDSLHRRIVRPNLTKDELLQIENDFNKFDVLKTGKVLPRTMVTFMNKNKEFEELNPWYFKAFKNLNTEENNKKGIDVNIFSEEVQNVIAQFNRKFEKNWTKIFENIAGGENEIIGKKELAGLVKNLGYKANIDDISNIIEKLEGDINKDRFLEVIKIIEYRFARFRNLLINKEDLQADADDE